MGAGAGAAFPFHADFDFTPWAWEVDARFRLSRFVAFEAAIGEWRHTDTSEMHGVPIQTDAGHAGTVGRVEQSSRRVQRAIQANVLLVGVLGRARVFGGGGAGLLQHHRRFVQTVSDCAASQVSICGTTENTFSDSSASVQGVGGADIGLAGPFAVYGQVRLIVPMQDPGGSDLRVTGGVRIGR